MTKTSSIPVSLALLIGFGCKILFWSLGLILPVSGVAAELSASHADTSSAPAAPSCHPDQPAASDSQANPIQQGKRVMSAGPYVPPTNLVVSEQQLKNGRRRKTVVFKNILIDRLYPSMGGPWSRTYLPMDPSPNTPYIWITRYRAEVLDSVTGKPAQEFMCHTKLDLFGGQEAPPSLRGVRSQFVISQGQIEAQFPKGFGLRVENHPERKIDVNIMVLNNNAEVIHRDVDFKATIDYVDDTAAQKNRMTPLFETAASALCPETQCESASYSSGGQNVNGQKASGHWIVPPGRQEVRTPLVSLVPYDTTVHYMLMHLHPYAESMELRDLTSGKSVWIGSVKNDPRQARLISTDYYSSARGLPIFKDHRYELVSIYNNTTSHPVDAMASLWMYAKDNGK